MLTEADKIISENMHDTELNLIRCMAEKNHTGIKEIAVPSPRESEYPPSERDSLLKHNKGLNDKDTAKRHASHCKAYRDPESPRHDMKTAANETIKKETMTVPERIEGFLKLYFFTC
ncbi:MAG: hypothetical protein K5770_12625 [Lachnospiraceae bacterium]|nr:hypothetical protein [Lachnospiraceae bacterium]